MKYADVNKRFTEIVAEYMGRGYTVNTRTMAGSQGEYAHIDLTDGTEVIRVLVDTFHEWGNISLDGLEIIVGRAESEVKPNSENDSYTLWNNKLDIISKERFYEIGADRRHGKFYGTLEEATAAEQLKVQRYIAQRQNSNAQDITEKAREIGKRVIRNRFGVKRINGADVKVTKTGRGYTVSYRGKAYALR